MARLSGQRNSLLEPRRILYNLLLAAIVAIHFVKGLPLSKSVVQFNALLLFC